MPPAAQPAPSSVVTAQAGLRFNHRIVALLVLGSIGFAARVVYAWYASGTNDIVTWQLFARQIAEQGLLYQYGHDEGFNHPPLMGLLARGVLALSVATGSRFAFLFKLPAIAADLTTGALLAHAWSLRTDRKQGALAFALYGWSPISFLISAHHGNTDSIYAMLVLASLVLSECHRARFAAGLALGAAINVKLIPIICVPAILLSGRQTLRDYGHFILGLSLGVIPFVPVLIEAGPEFYRNAIAYKSNRDNWGIAYLLRTLSEHGRFAPLVGPWIERYDTLGRQLIVVSVGAAAIVFGPTRRLSAWSLTALCTALFLVLTPGFGVQYSVFAAPVLFAVSPWRGFRYACASGLFVGAVYLCFYNGSMPFHTQLKTAFPAAAVPFGVVAWAWLVGFVGDTVAGGLWRHAGRGGKARFASS
jgi:hypothetical protein